MKFHTGLLIPVLIFTLVLTGCSPILQSSQPVVNGNITLDNSITIGQTFVSSYDGLEGIQIYLSPRESGNGDVSLYLRSNTTSEDNLGVSRMPLAHVNTPGYFRFNFPPINLSHQQYYYASLVVEGNGSILVGVSAPDSYLEGSLYQRGIPTDGQLSFSLVYSPGLVYKDIIHQIITWVGILIVAFFLYIIPGWALLSLFWNKWDEFDWETKLGLSCGVSISIYPLFFLWTDLFRLHLGAFYAWLPALFGTVFLFWKNRNSLINIFHKEFKFSYSFITQVTKAPDWFYVFIVVLIFAVRFWSIRTLEVPLWGDSLHHTTIVQLMIDHNGLFNSWEPYADLQSMTYHFGYHAATAAFHWITGLTSPMAILWVGQVFNGMAVIALYPLAVNLGKNKWAGIFAVLLAGLLFSMPMTYVNWGRYTQLAGLIILPTATFIIMELVKGKQFQWGLIALGWFIICGLALTHYRLLIYILLLIPVIFLFEIKNSNNKSRIIRIFVLGIGSSILFLPWFLHTISGRLAEVLNQFLTTSPQKLSSNVIQTNLIGDIKFYLPVWAWISLIVVIVWGILQKKRDIAIISIWWLLILLATNPAWLHLPGTGILTNFALFISVYLLAGWLLGTAISWILEYSQRYLVKIVKPYLGIIGMVALICIAFIGARQRLGDVNIKSSELVTRPDIRAASWIREHTPEDAKFLINSFFSYNDTLVVGSDAGWWLPILAGRKASLPPITYGFEEGTNAANLLEIIYLSREIQLKGITSKDVYYLLKERGIIYIYIGQQQGRVNYSGPSVLDPMLINNDPNFKVIYNQDRVWIFQIIP